MRAAVDHHQSGHVEAWVGAGSGPFALRRAAWESFLQRRILGVQILADANSAFFASARLGEFGGLSITRYEVGAQTMARTPRLADDGDGAYCLTLLQSGRFLARQGGQTLCVNPGQAVILPAAAASVFQITEPSVFWGVKFVDASLVAPPVKARAGLGLRQKSGVDVDILLAYCQLIDQLPPGGRSRSMITTINRHLADFLDASWPER